MLPVRIRHAHAPAFPGTLTMMTMLLAQDFPPMGGGIAWLHDELARRFRPGALIVSTPANRDASDVDGAFPALIDRLPISARITQTLPGLLFSPPRPTSLPRQ